jgi:phosphatidylinositol alpha-1,6-mannosyltransferase
LGESFIFTGSINEDDLVDLYRYSDLFSLVSDRGEGRGEGLPLTPLEAAACGKAIIVGNQDGSQEAVEDARSGYAIDPFDLERHANLINTLSQNRGLATSIGESARKRVLQNFSYDHFKDTTASIAQSIAQLG